MKVQRGMAVFEAAIFSLTFQCSGVQATNTTLCRQSPRQLSYWCEVNDGPTWLGSVTVCRASWLSNNSS